MNFASLGIDSDEARGIAADRFQRIVSRGRFVAWIELADYVTFTLMAAAWLKALAPAALAHRFSLTILASLFASAMVYCVFRCFRLYDFSVIRQWKKVALRSVLAGLIALGPFLGPLLTQPDIGDRKAALAAGIAASGFIFVITFRLLIASLADRLQQSGALSRRIYVITDNHDGASALCSGLERWPGNRVVGVWEFAGTTAPVEASLEGALLFLRNNPVDLVILKMKLSPAELLEEAARVLRRLPRTVLLSPSFEGEGQIALTSEGARGDDLGNILLVKLSDRPLAGWRWVIKDVQDRIIALILLIIVAPVLLAIALGLKITDPGPLFFRQKRYGYAGDTFDIIKFRTMRVATAAPEDGPSLTLTTVGDPRVTPIGRILRKTSLDELPQLLNVLKGDMWIVGPRPHSPYAKAGGTIYARAVQEYSARYRIKPGITGWAQVSGWRGPTETLDQLRNRVEHDLYYIENWTMFFDLRILFKTIFCVFSDKNAF